MEGTRINAEEQRMIHEDAFERERVRIFEQSQQKCNLVMPAHISVDYANQKSEKMWNRTADVLNLPASEELAPEEIFTAAPAKEKTGRSSIFWKVAAAVGVFGTLVAAIAALAINPHLLSSMTAHAQKLVSSGISFFK